MPILEINGRRVEVDDSFLSMTPDQQNATVDEIARSMGSAPQSPTIPNMLAGMESPLYASGQVAATTNQAALAQERAPQGDAGLYLAQRANRGLADTLGAPVDLATGLLNSILAGGDFAAQLGGYEPNNFRIKEPFLGSDWIANLTSDAYEGAGGTVVSRSDVSPMVGTIGEGVRGAASAAIPALALSSKAAQASRIPAALTKPYATAPGATIARDAAAGGGAMIGADVYDRAAPEAVQESPFGPLLKMAASMFGGATAMGTIDIAESAAGGVRNMYRNVVQGRSDPMAPFDSITGEQLRRTDMDTAAKIAQRSASNPVQAAANIDDNLRDFSQFARPNEVPTVGMLADDIGLAAAENTQRAKNAVPFAERDTARRVAAGRQMDTSVPPGADGRKFVDTAARQYDETLGGARAAVEDAAGRQQQFADDLARQNADLEGYRVRQPEVSAAMDSDFRGARQAAREAKNALYDAADPKTPVDGRFLDEAVRRIDAGMSEMERMSGGAYATIAQRVKDRLASDAPITYADIKALRAQISEARKAAVTQSGQSVAGSGADVQRLDQLGTVVNRLADEINPEAARNYREDYAPKFKQGRAGEYGAQIDRATATGGESSATRPSEFGGKFLRNPEDAASLRRALPDDLTAQNATEWMMGDLAKSGALTDNAQLRFDKVKQWADRNRKVIDQFPDLAKRIDTELANAQRGGALSKQFADEVAAAKAGLAQTERDLRSSALSQVLGKNPKNAVASIMDSGDPERQVAELVGRLKGNQEATDGLKAAVRDWIKERAGVTAKNVGEVGSDAQRYSRARLEQMFDEHEKTLAAIYSPDEMNALRQARKLLGAEAKLDVRATAGSNTFDKVMAEAKSASGQRWRMLEAGLKAKYGVLAGGGITRSIRLAAMVLPNRDAAIEQILFDMQFNPDLAKHLLTRPVKEVGTPGWNKRLNQLIAATAGARDSTEEE